MIPKKIKMSVMTSDGNGSYSFTGDKVYVPYPLRFWNADDRFYMNVNTGKGKYFWTSQMFGGPMAGDIVLFKNTKTPFFAIMTKINQDWDSRWGELKFLFLEKDYWNLLEESFIEMYHNQEITSEEFYQEMFKIFSIDDALDICCEEVVKFLNR